MEETRIRSRDGKSEIPLDEDAAHYRRMLRGAIPEAFYQVLDDALATMYSDGMHARKPSAVGVRTRHVRDKSL